MSNSSTATSRRTPDTVADYFESLAASFGPGEATHLDEDSWAVHREIMLDAARFLRLVPSAATAIEGRETWDAWAIQYALTNLQRWRERFVRAGWHDELSRVDCLVERIKADFRFVPSSKRRIGFNEFLGQVQHRLLKEGYDPGPWPDPTIRDCGDLEEALQCCVKWCKEKLDHINKLEQQPRTALSAKTRGSE